jgi:hypothetical protein
MRQNPYLSVLHDEISGTSVANRNHTIWQEGYDAGFEDCLEAFEHHGVLIENLRKHGATPEDILATLKESTPGGQLVKCQQKESNKEHES